MQKISPRRAHHWTQLIKSSWLQLLPPKNFGETALSVSKKWPFELAVWVDLRVQICTGSGIYNGLQQAPHLTAAYPGRTLPRSARARGLISQSFLISIRIAPLMCSDHYPELNLLRSPVGRCFRLIIVTGWWRQCKVRRVDLVFA